MLSPATAQLLARTLEDELLREVQARTRVREARARAIVDGSRGTRHCPSVRAGSMWSGNLRRAVERLPWMGRGPAAVPGIEPCGC
jgi:hypothetical protein